MARTYTDTPEPRYVERAKNVDNLGPEIPEPAAGDAGKVLKVGEDLSYELGEGGGGDLPEPTVADNMKALVVNENGEWNIGTAGYKVDTFTYFEEEDIVLTEIEVGGETFNGCILPSDFPYDDIYDDLDDVEVSADMVILGNSYEFKVLQSSEGLSIVDPTDEEEIFLIFTDDTNCYLGTLSPLSSVGYLKLQSKDILLTNDFEDAVKKVVPKDNPTKYSGGFSVSLSGQSISPGDSLSVSLNLADYILVTDGDIIWATVEEYITQSTLAKPLIILNQMYIPISKTLAFQLYNQDSTVTANGITCSVGVLHTGEATQEG